MQCHDYDVRILTLHVCRQHYSMNNRLINNFMTQLKTRISQSAKRNFEKSFNVLEIVYIVSEFYILSSTDHWNVILVSWKIYLQQEFQLVLCFHRWPPGGVVRFLFCSERWHQRPWWPGTSPFPVGWTARLSTDRWRPHPHVTGCQLRYPITA